MKRALLATLLAFAVNAATQTSTPRPTSQQRINPGIPREFTPPIEDSLGITEAMRRRINPQNQSTYSAALYLLSTEGSTPKMRELLFRAAESGHPYVQGRLYDFTKANNIATGLVSKAFLNRCWVSVPTCTVTWKVVNPQPFFGFKAKALHDAGLYNEGFDSSGQLQYFREIPHQKYEELHPDLKEMFAFILRGNNRSMYVANINPYAGTSNYYTFKAVVVRQAAPPQPTESRRFRPPEETEKLYDVGVPMPATQDIGEFDTLYRITGSNIEPIDLRSTLPWQRTHAARGNAKAQLDLEIGRAHV